MPSLRPRTGRCARCRNGSSGGGSRPCYEALGRGSHGDLPASPVELLEIASRLGAAADLVTVAEGIETKACLEACRALGFDAGQGYYCGMPAPAESFALAVTA